MSEEVRFNFTRSARLIARSVPGDDASLAAHTMGERRVAVEASAPEDLRARFGVLLGVLVAHRASYEEAARRGSGEEEQAVSPLPKLAEDDPVAVVMRRYKRSAYVLRDVNTTEDQLVRLASDTCVVALRRPEEDPQHEAAVALSEALFADGLPFLALESRYQWLEVGRRLERIGIDEALEAHIKALALERTFEDIRALNAWMGRMLGMDGSTAAAPASPPMTRGERLKAAHAGMLDTFGRLLALSNVAWPEDSEEHGHLRRQCVGPWFDAIAAWSAAVSARLAGAEKKPPAEGPAVQPVLT